MFKTIFDSLNMALDEIVFYYPLVDETQQMELQQKLSILKHYSDQCIKLWVSFEERVNALQSFIDQTNQAYTQIPIEITFVEDQNSAQIPIEITFVEEQDATDEFCIVISQLVFPFSKIVWYANNNRSD